ncbi:MAG: sugar MFS transporter [Oligoflexia bacterium]|nr:sugar MFS transporter [Oligoflexia bacterium]
MNLSISFFILSILFCIFGVITWLNATLIPYLKIACELTSNTQANLVAFAFYISYFFLALPSAWILNKTGYKKGMSLGLFTMSIGTLIFIPAAISRQYSLFLFGLFVQGAGLAILQTASNPYVIIIGPIESAAKRISFLGICNKFAGIISPLILGIIILNNVDSLILNLKGMDQLQKTIALNSLAAKVILPYTLMSLALMILAIALRFSPLPELHEDSTQNFSEENLSTNKNSILNFPYLWLGVLAIFLYVGVEVIAVDTLVLYGRSLGFSLTDAKFFSSFTLAAMIIGYIIGIITIPKFISQATALKWYAISGVLFSIIAILTNNITSIIAISLLGLSNAIMWPAIWPLALEGLGRFTKQASAFLIMGILGGAILPLFYGLLADTIGNKYAYIILIPSYIYLVYYAMIGHLVGKKTSCSSHATSSHATSSQAINPRNSDEPQIHFVEDYN